VKQTKAQFEATIAALQKQVEGLTRDCQEQRELVSQARAGAVTFRELVAQLRQDNNQLLDRVRDLDISLRARTRECDRAKRALGFLENNAHLARDLIGQALDVVRPIAGDDE
jgi:uncharacterized protein involved in exopolysaccharide biosynthesis